MSYYIVGKNQNGGHLAHYGIKGQQRGVRRFQNYDGTYTPEGLERYWPGSKHGERGGVYPSAWLLPRKYDKNEVVPGVTRRMVRKLQHDLIGDGPGYPTSGTTKYMRRAMKRVSDLRDHPPKDVNDNRLNETAYMIAHCYGGENSPDFWLACKLALCRSLMPLDKDPIHGVVQPETAMAVANKTGFEVDAEAVRLMHEYSKDVDNPYGFIELASRQVAVRSAKTDEERKAATDELFDYAARRMFSPETSALAREITKKWYDKSTAKDENNEYYKALSAYNKAHDEFTVKLNEKLCRDINRAAEKYGYGTPEFYEKADRLVERSRNENWDFNWWKDYPGWDLRHAVGTAGSKLMSQGLSALGYSKDSQTGIMWMGDYFGYLYEPETSWKSGDHLGYNSIFQLGDDQWTGAGEYVIERFVDTPAYDYLTR